MNPVLILTHNNLPLTKLCVHSVQRQDIANELTIIDNGSTDGTKEWLQAEYSLFYANNNTNEGVSGPWNRGLYFLFRNQEIDHVLVLNNDTILPPWFYRELLSYPEPFVTGVSVDKLSAIETPALRMPLCLHPDFSAFLIRREAWEKVGPFDERMKLYASDNDWHVRSHKAGIKACKANVPFYHERSSTLRHANPEERLEIESQANADRAVFKEKWGCSPWEPAYEELFK